MAAHIVSLVLAAAAWSQDGGDVRLRFVDALTGAPLADTSVYIWEAGHPFLSEEAAKAASEAPTGTTDENGLVVFTDVHDGGWIVSIHRRRSSGSPWAEPRCRVCYADRRMDVDAGNRGTIRETRTIDDGLLKITVTYADTGEPAPHTKVRTEAHRWEKPNPLPWRSEMIRPMMGRPVTDENGCIEEACSPGRYRMWADPARFAQTERVEVTVEPGEVCEVELIVDPADTYPRAFGHVTDTSGREIEGALVAVRKVNPGRLRTPAFTVLENSKRDRHTCRTSKRGVYGLNDLRYSGYGDLRDTEGPSGIAVIAERYAIDWVDFPDAAIGDEPRVVDFVLRSPARFLVEFTDRATGEELQSTRLAIDLYWPGRPRGEGPLRWLLKPNEQGVIQLEGCPPGECRWELMRVTETGHWGRPEAWEKIAEGLVTVTRGTSTLRAAVEVP